MRPFSLSITVDILDVGSRLRQVLLENFGPTLVHFMRTLGCASPPAEVALIVLSQAAQTKTSENRILSWWEISGRFEIRRSGSD